MSNVSRTTHIHRRAWMVIWTSFIIFCLLCVSVPTGFYWYLTSATDAAGAELQLIDNPIYLNGRLVTPDELGGAKARIRVGDIISTYTGGQAILWLDFDDGSNVHIWPNSEVRVAELQTNKFRWGNTARVITLEQRSGYSQVEVSASPESKRHFRILTNEANINLHEGSHSIRIIPPSQDKPVASLNAVAVKATPRKTEVAVRKGSAVITNQMNSITLSDNQKIEVAANEPLEKPEPAQWELLSNGGFNQGLDGWHQTSLTASTRGKGIEATHLDDRQVIRFSRQGDDHSEDSIRQVINRDVTEFNSLKLRASFKILEHSLSGGGVLGSEYPLMLRVTYRDKSGNIITWQHGFYSQNDDNLQTTLNGSPISEWVEQGSWKDYQVDLFDLSAVAPRPVSIISVEINCQGHTYVSAISGISLIGE